MFTSSTKREIKHFYVVVVQRRQWNVQKRVMYEQSCCFASLNLKSVFTHVASIYANLLEQKKAFAWDKSSTPN